MVVVETNSWYIETYSEASQASQMHVFAEIVGVS